MQFSSRPTRLAPNPDRFIQIPVMQVTPPWPARQLDASAPGYASSGWYNEAVAATRARRILGVDDDKGIREELAAGLGEDPAVDISVADDGWVALHQIATGQF